MPKGTPTEVNGARQQCYDFPSFKELLKFENRCTLCVRKLELSTQSNKLRSEQIRDLKIAFDRLEVNFSAMRADRDRVFELWKEENRKRHEAENRPNFGAWLGWGLAAIATSAAVTLAITR